MDSAWPVGPGLLVGKEGGRVLDAADGEPFDAFVRREQAGLVRLASLLAGSRAQGEDIVQDVLVKVLPKWSGLATAPAARLAYVRRAVTHEHVSWRRRWTTRHVRFVDPQLVPEVPVDPAALRDDDLWQRVQRLPVRQQAAVVLRFHEGLTDAEIAEALGCREGTVRAHVSRGVSALRAAYVAADRDGVAR